MEILIGFFIALAITMTGSGAGTITAPVMMIFLGISPEIAVGTTLLFSLLVKIPVGISYTMKGQVDKKILSHMATGGIAGVIIGSYLLKSLTSNEELKSVVLGVVGVIVLFSASLNVIFMLKNGNAVKLDERLQKLIPLFTFFIGLEVGFSSAGAGVLGTLLLMYTTSLVPRQIIGTDIMFGLILSAVGGGLYLAMGNVDFYLLGKLLAGAVIGIPLGLYGALKIPAKPLKIGLLVWIFFIGTQLIYHSLRT
ncbi:MAG: sulfite exporter TauE/SafE family protein [Leptospirales bacterium]